MKHKTEPALFQGQSNIDYRDKILNLNIGEKIVVNNRYMNGGSFVRFIEYLNERDMGQYIMAKVKLGEKPFFIKRIS